MTARRNPQVVRRTAIADEPHIVSIVPAAPGWWAIWRDTSGAERFPVAAWARIEYRHEYGVTQTTVAMIQDSDRNAELAPAVEREWAGLEYGPAAP